MNSTRNFWSSNAFSSWAQALFRLFKTVENSKTYSSSLQSPRIEPFIGSLDRYTQPHEDTGQIEPKLGSLSSFKQPPRVRTHRKTESDILDQPAQDACLTQRQPFTYQTSSLFRSDEGLFNEKLMSSSFDHELDRLACGYITNPATGLPITSGRMIDRMGYPYGFSRD